jgi:hypothetical protein
VAKLVEDYSLYSDDGHVGSDLIRVARRELDLERLERSVLAKFTLVREILEDDVHLITVSDAMKEDNGESV